MKAMAGVPDPFEVEMVTPNSSISPLSAKAWSTANAPASSTSGPISVSKITFSPTPPPLEEDDELEPLLLLDELDELLLLELEEELLLEEAFRVVTWMDGVFALTLLAAS